MKITIDISNISYYALDQIHAVLVNVSGCEEAARVIGERIEEIEKKGDFFETF